MTAGALLSLLVVTFAWGVATFPGEWQEKYVTVPWLFSGDIDTVFRRPRIYFANTLILPEFNLYEALRIEDPKKVEWKEHLIDLYDRDLTQAVLPRAILPRADLRFAQLQGARLAGAQLQGASLDGAQLQGASLAGAQLQGASLYEAQLQGAILDRAELQGASLSEAQLQGALLDYVQLQGASLYLAQLHGASLVAAQLQGASLNYAQLHGASFSRAQLQGAFLDHAQLQGTSLAHAQLKGASLVNAGLWRAQLSDSVAKDLFAPAGSPDWSPNTLLRAWSETRARLWGENEYDELVRLIEREVPEDGREGALKRVKILDCERKGGDLASCDPAADPSDSVKAWKKMIEGAKVDQGAYAKALATILGDLVCSNEAADGIYVLRGLLSSERFLQTGAEMPTLAKRITSPECPVSTALTDADKTAIAEAAKEAVSLSKSP